MKNLIINLINIITEWFQGTVLGEMPRRYYDDLKPTLVSHTKFSLLGKLTIYWIKLVIVIIFLSLFYIIGWVVMFFAGIFFYLILGLVLVYDEYFLKKPTLNVN